MCAKGKKNDGATLEQVEEVHGRESGYEESSVFEDRPALPSKEEAEARDQALGRRESKAIAWIRVLVFLTIAAVAAAVCALMYNYARQSEEESFESSFADHSSKLVDAFTTNARRRVKAIDSLSQAFTSHTVNTDVKWPLVTLPDYERRASTVMDLAEVVAIFMFPIVTNDTREAWEEYAIENQGWIQEGLEIRQEEILGRMKDQGAVGQENEQSDLAFLESFLGDENAGNNTIPAHIYQPIGADVGPEDGPGPYFPVWQWAPALPLWDLVNFNAVKGPSHTNELLTILDTERAVTSKAFDFKDESDPNVFGRKPLLNLILNRWKGGGNDYEDGPVSDLYYPIYDSFNITSRKLVAVFDTLIYWQVYFVDILPQNADGVIAVLENTCNQSFTYAIDGPKARYLGQGDLHDPKYSEYEVSTGFGAFLGSKDFQLMAEKHHCSYNIKVYPSQTMEDHYSTNTPALFTIILVCVFGFTSLVFIAYDLLVARRQRVVLETAVKSTEVVEQLFPLEVREGLYNQSKPQRDTIKRGTEDEVAKFLSSSEGDDDDFEDENDDSMPNAHTYENATVFFADIAGFTAWSANRTPEQVFKLLEMLYGTFDKIAAKRLVFKVETIGDCYMCVTGCPKPQADHAIRMARFANECQLKMSQMRGRLAGRLGPETTELSLRIGLHSGPVTGGVLRGHKARFQLFGDTVNSASRMESTGKPWKIQASEATAALLRQAGKGDWLRAREDLVEAKGKGTLQTYWIELRGEGTVLTRTTDNSMSNAEELGASVGDILEV